MSFGRALTALRARFAHVARRVLAPSSMYLRGGASHGAVTHGKSHGEHKHEVKHDEHGHHDEYVPEARILPVEGPLFGIATGREREELLYELAAVKPFGDEILYGPFGTRENPVIVESYYNERIVGCNGSEEEPHELAWHLLEANKPLVCLECGQVFKHKLVGPGHAH